MSIEPKFAACKRPELKYAVTFTNQITGERREVVVELNPAEMLDMLWNLANGRQAGHPDGPLAKRYAHARAIGMVLDRVHPVETTHRVAVEHSHKHQIVATEKVLERIRELAQAAGLNPQSLSPTIDGTCEDITDKQAS